MRELQGQVVLNGRLGPVRKALNTAKPLNSGGWVHLAARFFGVLGARRLDEVEERQVRTWLRTDEHPLFFNQPVFDQRHGFKSAGFVAEHAEGRLDLIRAALMHDMGKRHAGMGPFARSAASTWAKAGGRSKGDWPNPRWNVYLNHGAVAAQELSEVGAEPIVVAFARNHHGERPEEITEADWALLMNADRV